MNSTSEDTTKSTTAATNTNTNLGTVEGPSEPVVEWDDSEFTLTAWNKAKKNRAANAGRRTYGRARGKGKGSGGYGYGSKRMSASTARNGINSGNKNSFSEIVNRAKLKQEQERQQEHESSYEQSQKQFMMHAATASSSLSSLDFDLGIADAGIVDAGADGNENSHPNISSASMKITTSNLAPFSSSVGNNANFSCFKSLSRSASLNSHGSAYGKLGGNHHVSATTATATAVATANTNNSNDIGGESTSTRAVGNLNYCTTTPSRSASTTSSRKRGVFDSPLVYNQDDYDEYYNNCSNDHSHHSNSGVDPMSGVMMNGAAIGGSRRSNSSYGSRRARSRIFSPDSTKKLMDMEEAKANMYGHGHGIVNASGGIYDCLGASSNAGGGGGPLSSQSSLSNINPSGIVGASSIIRKKEESFQESDDDDHDANEELNMSILLSASCETHEEVAETLLPSDRIQMLPIDTYATSQVSQVDDNRIDAAPALHSQLPPNRLKRMSSVGSGTFEQAIFQPVESTHTTSLDIASMYRNPKSNVEAQHPLQIRHIGGDDGIAPTNKLHDEHSSIFATMSSYDDLKFLIKELRRWNENRQTAASFGFNNNCTIVPPNKWKHERKLLFIEWTTCHLGFCRRSGGGKLVYLQTSVTKGKRVLKDLEAALLSYKQDCKRSEQQDAELVQEQRRLKSSNTLIVNQSDRNKVPPLSSIKILRRDVPTPLLPSSRQNMFR